MTNRRTFLTVLAGGLLAAPLAAGAQQARVYKIGFLDLNPAPNPRFEVFRQALRELGWVEGKSITFEYRSAPGKSDEVLTALAEELAQLGVDVILTMSNRGIVSARRGAPRVPIVMVISLDPVGTGLIESLARPGGTITGLTYDTSLEIGGKRCQLIKELVPGLSRVINLWDPRDPGVDRYGPEVRRAASTLGVVAESVEVRSQEDLEKGLAIARRATKRHSGMAGAISEYAHKDDLHVRAAEQVTYADDRDLPGVRGRVFDRLCAKPGGSLSARRDVCRQDPQGGGARRSPHRAALEVRAGPQPQNREGSGPDHSPVAPAAGGSGD